MDVPSTADMVGAACDNLLDGIASCMPQAAGRSSMTPSLGIAILQAGLAILGTSTIKPN